jgi:hypothetical protein
MNVGLQPSMGLPPFCERCQVALREEAEQGDES